jgi:RNA polymerase sigma-70 factor (ECF subfamily)
MGLLALMVLHESRRATRVDAARLTHSFENQNPSLCVHGWIADAKDRIERAEASRRLER